MWICSWTPYREHKRHSQLMLTKCTDLPGRSALKTWDSGVSSQSTLVAAIALVSSAKDRDGACSSSLSPSNGSSREVKGSQALLLLKKGARAMNQLTRAENREQRTRDLRRAVQALECQLIFRLSEAEPGGHFALVPEEEIESKELLASTGVQYASTSQSLSARCNII